MVCNCVNCDCSIQLCKYKCEISGYNIYNENNEFIKKQYDCDIDLENDSEINVETNIEYCPMCNINIEYPDSYDNTNHIFKNNDENIYHYENFLKRNLIHNFTNIQCPRCSNILNQGKFTIENIEETESNLNELSIPNDFIKDIKIYDLQNNLIKSITPSDYSEYRELTKFTTELSKNILYCSNCNYIILNNLKKI
jgi:hypothetical protein